MNEEEKKKIEVGEYVRDTDGIIVKLYGRIGRNYVVKPFKGKIYELTEKQLYKNLTKHSKNIIDLIEVKDVIKYRIDNISTTLETKGYVEGIVDISDEEMLQRIKNDNNYHILEILTKEQYLANCYKVGGEDE